VLAAKGAYRAGAGLVALAVPESIRATVAAQMPEATYPPISASRLFDAGSAGELLSRAAACDSLLVGPGIGAADSFVDSLLGSNQALPPLVVDADGLNILAGRAEWYKKLPAGSILTPHPGEMARLLDRPPPELRGEDRVELAREAARAWGHVILLKGAYTVIASPGGECALLPFANPLLAVGGSGDVLAGMISAFLAQGMAPYDAAILGSYLHGAAAELAAGAFGEAGLLAGELADWVPAARRRLAAT
jgi:NAD(P)H-hydrate epimerase